MNDRKLQALFSAAREAAPEPPPGFAERVVMRARAHSGERRRSLGEELDRMALRWGLAALAVILLCVGAEFGTPDSDGDLSVGVVQLSDASGNPFEP